MPDIEPQVLHDVFAPQEVQRLLAMLDRCDWEKIKLDDTSDLRRVQYQHKHIHYNHQRSPFRHVIHPKIKKIIGHHECSHSVYNEVHRPAFVHLDTRPMLDTIEISQTSYTRNIAMLLCLSEHPDFRTAFFDHMPNNGIYTLGDKLPDSGHDNASEMMDLLDHHPDSVLQQLKRVPISAVIEWKIGSVLMWDRRKLHCSTNFTKQPNTGTKRFVLLFV